MPELTDSELIKLIDKAIMKFHGNSEELENAMRRSCRAVYMGGRYDFLFTQASGRSAYRAAPFDDLRSDEERQFSQTD